MIIDLILDRKDGRPYTAQSFKNYLTRSPLSIGNPILAAFNSDDEETVKNALAEYIHNGNYNPDLINYINSVNWLTT